MTDRSIKIVRSEITKNNFVDTLDYKDVKLICNKTYSCRNLRKYIPKIIALVQQFLRLE